MKLLSLKLENFQGIKAAEFAFDGKSASLYGDNATGKTTVFNALTWLLFDKASTGAKNFTPKTKGPDGDLHNLDHAVEGVLALTDGRQLTLKKVYHENWKKTRGSNAPEFSGHSVDFFLEGVPAKEKEYNEAGSTDSARAIVRLSGPPPSSSFVPTTNSGALNPEFSRWLMGYPPAWLSCAGSATRSSRR